MNPSHRTTNSTRPKPSRRLLAALLALLAGQSSHAATYYWDTNGTDPGSGAATGTWDSGVSALWSTTANGTGTPTAVTTTSADTVRFSATTPLGTAGTVTVSGAQVAAQVVLQQAGLSFTGGSITTPSLLVNSSATIGTNFINGTNLANGNTNTVQFQTSDQKLTFTGGGSNFLTINGSSAAIGRSSTLAFDSGTYVTTAVGANLMFNLGNVTTETGGVEINNGASYTYQTNTSSYQVGNGQDGLLKVNAGGSFSVTSSANFLIGRGAGNGKLLVNGGSVSVVAPVTIGFRGNAGTTNTVTVSGGSLTTASDIGIGVNHTAASAAVLNISGGVVTTGAARGVVFGGANGLTASTAGSGTLNMTGGTLYVGTTGITNVGTTAYTVNGINLSGGTIGALGAWSSNLGMTLGTTNGPITFKAANAADTAFNISLSGPLTGTGGLVKTGAGTLTLSNASNAYVGTTVSAGTLAVSGSGTLGTGAVSIASGATLDLTAITPASFTIAGGLGGSGSILATGKTVAVTGAFTPGASPGVLSVTGGLNLTGSTQTYEINGATRGTLFDGVNVSGTLTYGGSMAFVFGSSFMATAPLTTTSFDIFRSLDGSAAPGAFGSSSISALSISGAYVSTLSQTSAGVWTGTGSGFDWVFTEASGTLSATAIPEPSTFAGLAGLAALGLALRRRRNG